MPLEVIIEYNIIHTRIPNMRMIRVAITQEQITSAIVSANKNEQMLSFEAAFPSDSGEWEKRKVTIWPTDIAYIEQVTS